MKLTLGKLRNLIKEVVKENRMVIAEEQIELTFDQFKEKLEDKQKTGKLQRLGIMTAENPRGMPSSDEENVELMQDFAKVLDQKGMQYLPIGGKYGNPENSYIIMNPTMLDMVEFGKKYGQAAVIYGQKMRRSTSTPADPIFFRFDYVQTEPDGDDEPPFPPEKYIVKDSQDMIVKTDADDLYSELDGTKFKIPFFSGNEMPPARYVTATDVEGEMDAYKGNYERI